MVCGYEQMANNHRYGVEPRYAEPLDCYRMERSELTSRLESISLLEPYCCEFLVHAADNEGLQAGIDHELVQRLAEWCSIPVTYAGGGRSLEDLEIVKALSSGKVDLTIGSALDIFGGNGVTFEDCVKWNLKQAKAEGEQP